MSVDLGGGRIIEKKTDAGAAPPEDLGEVRSGSADSDVVPQRIEADNRDVHRMSRFYIQAEDGIRAWSVTGVQTCALPICPRRRRAPRSPSPRRARTRVVRRRRA